jgi:hypothetical protein
MEIEAVEIVVVTSDGRRYFSLGDVTGERRSPDEPLEVILKRLVGVGSSPRVAKVRAKKKTTQRHTLYYHFHKS